VTGTFTGTFTLSSGAIGDSRRLTWPPIIQKIFAALEAFFGAAAGTINWTVLEQTAFAAFAAGGPSAVVPALIKSVDTWCTGSSFEKFLLVSLLQVIGQLPL
jgi:hypothetical protein